MPSASIMYFCISFENSGDTLPFESINTQILEYYVERLNYLGINRFKIYNPTLKFIKSTIDNLDFIIQKLWKVLHKM
jgi:hypothetical protein